MADDERSLESIIRVLEGGRRVGWAKYYDAVRNSGLDEAHRYDLELAAAGHLMWLLALTEHREDLADRRDGWLETLVEVIRDNSDARILLDIRIEYDPILSASGPSILAAIDSRLAQPGEGRRAAAARFIEEGGSLD